MGRDGAFLGLLIAVMGCHDVADVPDAEAGVEAAAPDSSVIEAGVSGITIASTLTKPDSLLVDNTNVYWATFGPYGAVMACSLAGCTTPAILANEQAGVNDMAMSATTLYWGLQMANFGAIRSCDKSGCSFPAGLAGAQDAPTAYALDGTTLYWADRNAIMKCDVGSCTPTTFVSTPGPMSSIVVDGTNVYWTNYGSASVQGCAVSGCSAPTDIATSQVHPGRMAVDGASIYWTENADGQVLSCPAAVTACTPTIVASGCDGAWALAADATDLYVTCNFAGTVMRCDKPACTTPTVIASGQSGPYAIALDATTVYWTNDAHGASNEGSVMKLAK